MNVYQLVPTPSYDDDDSVNAEFWSDGTEDDGRSSRSGFYADDVSGSEEMVGWYNIVNQEGTASVPPVPHLPLSFDVEHFKFFDDDSSADNETFFGRTLDTISEEDEDDSMERLAEATDAETDSIKQHECSTDEQRTSADLSKLASVTLWLSLLLLMMQTS